MKMMMRRTDEWQETVEEWKILKHLNIIVFHRIHSETADAPAF